MSERKIAEQKRRKHQRVANRLGEKLIIPYIPELEWMNIQCSKCKRTFLCNVTSPKNDGPLSMADNRGISCSLDSKFKSVNFEWCNFQEVDGLVCDECISELLISKIIA
jgi:hypothetical protein